MKNYAKLLQLFEVDASVFKRSEEAGDAPSKHHKLRHDKSRSKLNKRHHNHQHHHSAQPVSDDYDATIVEDSLLTGVGGQEATGAGSSGSASASSVLLSDGIGDQYEGGQPAGVGFMDVCASVM